MTSRGWKPSVLGEIESLLEAVHAFWLRHAVDFSRAIAATEGRYIHLISDNIRADVRRYGCFFNAVLMSDQLQIRRQEYRASRSTPDIQHLLPTVISEVYRYIGNPDIFEPEARMPYAFIAPVTACLDEGAQHARVSAAMDMGLEFVSELSDSHFSALPEFFEAVERGKLGGLKESLLPALFGRHHATTFREYVTGVLGALRKEQGLATMDKDPVGKVIYFDVSARLSEFERVHADAFLWEQEAEYEDADWKLFEWWFERSAKKAGLALGTSYSEDALYKFAAQSNGLSFLQGISEEEYFRFLDSDPVGLLREDLAISRVRLRRAGDVSLPQCVREAGEYVVERIRRFEDDVTALASDGKAQVQSDLWKLGGALALTSASVACPPLAVTTLLWGGTAYDSLKDWFHSKSELKQRRARPLAVLAAWRRREKGPDQNRILHI